MIRAFVLSLLLFTTIFAKAQQKPSDSQLLRSLFEQSGDSILKMVVADPTKFRLQIIYTEINRDKNNTPSFINHYFHYDPELYFNPASMVKFPLALLALEKINVINKKKISRTTTIIFDSAQRWHRPLKFDSTAPQQKPTIAHFIKRAFLISENDPYNRLYQFAGQQEINRVLHAKGYRDVRITRQFMGLTPEQNRITNSIRFLNKKGKTIYAQPSLINTDSFDFSRSIRLGKAYMNSRDSIINEPFDFTKHNNVSLFDFQQMLQSAMFPESVPQQQRFYLKQGDYHFLWQYLSQFPSETPYPKYDTAKFYDSYVKFFFRNASHKLPEGVRVFNKVGWSYGFLTDVSYVADFKNKVEYMLSATLYVNSDEILNDGKYDYNSIGYPFLYQLGQLIWQYELKRQRAFRPDLSKFIIRYETRDPLDKRPSLKDVDN